MSSAAVKKWESDGKQIVVQCPACQTRFSLVSTVLEGVSSPRFHCSRCDHVFALPDFIFDAAEKTAQTRPSTPVPQSLEEPPAPELPSDFSEPFNPVTQQPVFQSSSRESNGTLVYDSPTLAQAADFSVSSYPDASETALQNSQMAVSVNTEPPTEIRALLSSAEQMAEQRLSEERTKSAQDLSGLDRLLKSASELPSHFQSAVSSKPKASNFLKSIEMPLASASSVSVSAPREVDIPATASKASKNERKSAAKDKQARAVAPSSLAALDLEPGSQELTQSQLALFSPRELGPQDFSRMNSPLAEAGPVLDHRAVGNTASSSTTARDVIVPIRRDWAAAAFVAVPLISTLFALAFLGFYLTTSNTIAKGVVSNLLSGMPMPPPAGLYLKKTELQVLTLDSGEEIATLTGTVRNDSAKQFTSVVVEGLAFNTEGHSIGRGLGNVGSPINRARIKSLSPDAIVDLQSKVSKKFQLKPGEERQFTVALEKVKPADIKFYSARMFQVN